MVHLFPVLNWVYHSHQRLSEDDSKHFVIDVKLTITGQSDALFERDEGLRSVIEKVKGTFERFKVAV